MGKSTVFPNLNDVTAKAKSSLYSPRAMVFVTAMIAFGLIVLVLGLFPFKISDPVKFGSYAVLSGLATWLRVSLPTVRGTLSIHFLFLLLGLVELTLSEVMVLGAVMTLLQCLIARDRQPNAFQIAFNVAVTALAVVAAGLAYKNPFLLQARVSPAMLLICAALVLFVVTTVPVAVAIALTENRKIVQTWLECSLWAAPYYLAGAAVTILFSTTTQVFGWRVALLILPIGYLISRSYQLYLARIEDGRRHAEMTAELHLRTIEALALAIEAKDTTTHEHLRRVQVYAMEIGKEVGISKEEMEALRAAALLHDIGKLAVPEHILSKPGRLTKEEFDKMKIHPIVGAEIIEQAKFPYPVAPIVRSHHEKWNGEGYPDGLKGEQIPIGARILSAVDCLDALATDRQYRRGLPLHEALAWVVKEAGKSFDPQIVSILSRRCVELEAKAHAKNKDESNFKLSTSVKVERGAAPAAGFATTESKPSENDESRTDFMSVIAAARQEVQTLFELSANIGSSLSLKDTYTILAERLKDLVPHDALALYMVEGRLLVPSFVNGENYRLFSSLEIPVGQGLSGWVVENRQPILNGNPSVEPGYLNDPEKFSTLRSAIAVPLESDGQIAGVLALYSIRRDAFTKDHLRILLGISERLTLAIQNAKKFEQAASSSVTDYLTGLPNSRSLANHLALELQRCKANGQALEVLVGDLNGFKRVNDTFGHLEGNRLLKEVAVELRNKCRDSDYVARLGGDEFVVVLPGLPAQAVNDRITQLSAVVRNASDRLNPEFRIGLAIGGARFPDDGADADALLAIADQRMYVVKSQQKGVAVSRQERAAWEYIEDGPTPEVLP